MRRGEDMARKAVLSGGKRDEIIFEAMKLFFENGYEATSVRMIMDQVGGEIGMFYHYFKSKESLFDCAVERFFADYQVKFDRIICSCSNPESFVDAFLPIYTTSMEQFGRLKENMHWTIQYAMSAKTIHALLPAVITLLASWRLPGQIPPDIAAGQLVYGISATIHSESFEKMDTLKKKECLVEYINQILRRDR